MAAGCISVRRRTTLPLLLRGQHKSDAEEQQEDAYFSRDLCFCGPFASIRKQLDYSYHSNYSFVRQRLQDAIILDSLDAVVVNGATTTTTDTRNDTTGSAMSSPHIVFTAGAMGAGKSYTLRKLNEDGRFPLGSFVSVDPDAIRKRLPEFQMYLRQSPELAGKRTQAEAGFIAEILTLACLHAGKNILVDGSLRDAAWYQQYFKFIRAKFPQFRLSILHVTAPREAVFQRAEHRARVTGRVVPRALLEESLEQVPRSVKILMPLVDYHVELRNSSNSLDIELASPSGESWDSFQSRWSQNCSGRHRSSTRRTV